MTPRIDLLSNRCRNPFFAFVAVNGFNFPYFRVKHMLVFNASLQQGLHACDPDLGAAFRQPDGDCLSRV